MNASELIEHLKEASALSHKGLGYVSPNPCVGCVILDSQGRKIAQGYHERYGEGHAEANALKSLSHPDEQLKGAYVLVTLEPCAHEGKTPSCARTLSRYPLAGVIALVKDPNPLVCGQGFEILKQSGCKTLFIEDLLSQSSSEFSGWEEDWALSFKEILDTPKLKKMLHSEVSKNQALNAPFFYAIQNARPFITLKWAQSLNGVIGSPYKRLMISGARAQEWTHHLRATRDVTLVGYKTILQDNPGLNIRLGEIQKENQIAIVDSRLRILDQRAKHNIFSLHSPQNTFIITDEMLKGQPKCEGFSGNLIFVGRNLNGQLNLTDAMTQLRQDYNVHSVLVEGGADILKDFYELDLWNEICVYVAPKFLKGTKIKISLWNILLKFFKKISLKYLFPDLNINIRKP